MLRYAHAFLAQTTTTALANGRSKIEERLGALAPDGATTVSTAMSFL